MSNIKWSKPAQADLAAIDSYLNEHDPEVASLRGWKAISAALFLAACPEAGPAIGYKDWRKWTVSRTPYILLYSARGNGVQIQRVQHNRQSWKPRA